MAFKMASGNRPVRCSISSDKFRFARRKTSAKSVVAYASAELWKKAHFKAGDTLGMFPDPDDAFQFVIMPYAKGPRLRLRSNAGDVTFTMDDAEAVDMVIGKEKAERQVQPSSFSENETIAQITFSFAPDYVPPDPDQSAVSGQTPQA